MPSDTELLDWMANQRKISLDPWAPMRFNVPEAERTLWRVIVYSPIPNVSSLEYRGKTPREAITAAMQGLADMTAKLGVK